MYRSRQMARIEEKLDRILELLEPEQPQPEQAPAAQPGEPLPGYDKLNVAETLDALKDHKGDRDTVARVLAYELAHKNRSGVVDQLVNWNS